MITSKDSVVRGEVMMTNDLSSRQRSWSVLPMDDFGGNEVRDRAMVVGNGLSNLDQQLVAPECTGPGSHGCRRVAFDITHDFTALFVKPQRLWGEEEAPASDVGEESLHVVAPGF